MVVQHEQQRRFDEGEEAFLITLSAQLAGVIASAEATGAIAGISPSGQKFQTPFLPVSRALPAWRLVKWLLFSLKPICTGADQTGAGSQQGNRRL